MSAPALVLSRLASPLGAILLVSEGERLRALDFADYEARMHRLLARHYGEVTLQPGRDASGTAEALTAYFDGRLDALDTLSVATGGSEFQRRVWAMLRTIPAGTTTTYGALAQRLGKPSASRAVGLANGANPISIVVPCHRVVGANGALTGYAGGLERKRWLLGHEGVALG